MFSVKTRNCRVENACKVLNLVRMFALHLQLLPRKTASQTQFQQLQGRSPCIQEARSITRRSGITFSGGKT
ncbi:hypothetical protein EBQ34_02255 [Vandammella animalimorsus]|uniref:Uncharacterized protein n=1 Tax=Vandammella animalimorsus TaxID=2029117 RepID=A0A3M6RUK8_9BURK|nr:hypothetical protein EBQ34_02255 [Vandammella animalimorsus]